MASDPSSDGESSDDALGDDDAYRPLTEAELPLESALLDDLHT